MPNKSRHSHRKKSFKPAGKEAPAAQTAAQPNVASQAPPAEQYKTPVHLRAASPATTRTAPVAVARYPYVKKELLFIGILAVIILVILVVLSRIL